MSSSPEDADFSEADHEELLDSLIHHMGESLRPPNSSWLKRYYQLTGEEYVLAEGFGRAGTTGWVPIETYRSVDRSSPQEFEIFDRVNSQENKEHA